MACWLVASYVARFEAVAPYFVQTTVLFYVLSWRVSNPVFEHETWSTCCFSYLEIPYSRLLGIVGVV